MVVNKTLGNNALLRANARSKSIRTRRSETTDIEGIATLDAEGPSLSVPEVAQVVGLHPITIRREIRAGRLRATGAGNSGRYNIKRTDANDWWRSRGGSELFVGSNGNATGPLDDFLAKSQEIVKRLKKTAPDFKGIDSSALIAAGRVRPVPEPER